MLDEWLRKSSENDDERKTFFQGKKSQYILVIIIFLGLLALIWPVTKTEQPVLPAAGSDKIITDEDSVKMQLTAELESILAQIEGAGEVNVSLTLDSDGVKTYASNIRDESREIQETDSRGTKKQTSEKSVQRDLAVSSGTPLLLEDRFPEVMGVLVVAEGARTPEIREKLTNATVTLLNISPHKVRVMSRKGEK